MPLSSARNPLFLRDEELDSSLELLMSAQLRLAASVRPELDARGLQFDDFVLLFLLWRRPGLSMTELHTIGGMTRQSLSRHVSALARRDLVEVEIDGNDRRRRLVRPTGEACRLLGELVTRQRRLLKTAFAAAGVEAVEGFREVAAAAGSADVPGSRKERIPGH